MSSIHACTESPWKMLLLYSWFFSVVCFKNKHNLGVEKRYCSYNLFITCLKKGNIYNSNNVK